MILQDFTLDLRPFDQDEWSSFDGTPFECLKCQHRYFWNTANLNKRCPSCGALTGIVLTNAEAYFPIYPWPSQTKT